MKSLGFILSLISLFLVSPVVAGEILIIESFHSTNRWDSGYLKALNKVLARNHTISYFEMDAKRLPTSQHKKRAEAAWQRYQQTKPDFVILGDDIAIDFLGKKFADEQVPVVFLGANKNPRTLFKNGEYPANFTGVLERPLIKKSVEALLKILPKAQKILVLFDRSEASSHAVDQRQYRTNKIGAVWVDIKYVGALKEWRYIVEQAKALGYDAVIIGYHSEVKAENGVTIPEEAILTWTSQTVKVPLFAFWDAHVGPGKAVGGVLIDGYGQGKVAARLMVQVTFGRIPDTVMYWKGRMAFSRLELERWAIKLPKTVMKQAKITE